MVNYRKPLWLFEIIIFLLHFIDHRELHQVLLRLIDLCEQFFGEDLALRKVRFWIRTNSCWLFFGQTVIQVSTKSKSLQEMRTAVQQLFSQPMPMLPRTDLRQ